MTPTDLLTEMRDRFGLNFSEVDTGGGCFALEARLESGHWIVATSTEPYQIGWRIKREQAEREPYGWVVGIYPNNTAHGEDWWGSSEAIVLVEDHNAFAGDLKPLIHDAITQLAWLPQAITGEDIEK